MIGAANSCDSTLLAVLIKVCRGSIDPLLAFIGRISLALAIKLIELVLDAIDLVSLLLYFNLPAKGCEVRKTSALPTSKQIQGVQQLCM